MFYEQVVADSFANSIAGIIAETPGLHLVTCSRFRRLLAMAPKQHAIPKAKRSCTGDNGRLRDCDANAIPEEIESACMTIRSQLGYEPLGVPASVEDGVMFEAYRQSGELGSVIVASVHRVPTFR